MPKWAIANVIQELTASENYIMKLSFIFIYVVE